MGLSKQQRTRTSQDLMRPRTSAASLTAPASPQQGGPLPTLSAQLPRTGTGSRSAHERFSLLGRSLEVPSTSSLAAAAAGSGAGASQGAPPTPSQLAAHLRASVPLANLKDSERPARREGIIQVPLGVPSASSPQAMAAAFKVWVTPAVLLRALGRACFAAQGSGQGNPRLAARARPMQYGKAKTNAQAHRAALALASGGVVAQASS